MRALSRTLCVFFCALFLLGGCEAKTPPATDFSAAFSAAYRGMTVEGNLSRSRQGLLTIKLSKPETLGGLRVSYRNGELQLGRNRLLCTADEAYLPDDSFPALLKSALDALDNAAPEQELNLTAACGAVHITTDENGLPTALECPEHDLRVRFSDSEAL